MFDFIVKGLATWRLSNLLVKEGGPLDILWIIREKSGIVYDEQDRPIVWPSWNPLWCVWCTSIWVAGIIMIMPRVVSWILALSAVTCIVDNVVSEE
jgi:hypothetical protein